MEPPRPRSTTRANARPFAPDEQRRVLHVGACLTCHEPTDTEIERIYRSFEESLARVTPACVVAWPESGRRTGLELMSHERAGGPE
jgi:hypothetical protein